MTEPKSKSGTVDAVENALNETRILILVAQVLVGFEFQGVFQEAFMRLPVLVQEARLGGICLMLAALALFQMPAACHQIADRGRLTASLSRLLTKVTCLGLLPFSLGFSGDIALAAGKILNSLAGGLLTGAATAVSVLFLLYGIGWLGRRSHRIAKQDSKRGNSSKDKEMTKRMNDEKGEYSEPQSEETKEKIKLALMEARVVLPGTQALLGFQLAAVLMQGFDHLSLRQKEIHLFGLLCIAASATVLMAPAAYHRIARCGDDSESLLRFTSRMLLRGMFLLAAGLCADLAVVFEMVTHSQRAGQVAALVGLASFCGFWLGYPLLRRLHQETGVDAGRA